MFICMLSMSGPARYGDMTVRPANVALTWLLSTKTRSRIRAPMRNRDCSFAWKRIRPSKIATLQKLCFRGCLFKPQCSSRTKLPDSPFHPPPYVYFLSSLLIGPSYVRGERLRHLCSLILCRLLFIWENPNCGWEFGGLTGRREEPR